MIVPEAEIDADATWMSAPPFTDADPSLLPTE
jgi:hypothetical protein